LQADPSGGDFFSGITERTKRRIFRFSFSRDKVMKNRSGEYHRTRETLPLERGGKRVGVKEHPRSHFYPSP
jgi:hypothetical protein